MRTAKTYVYFNLQKHVWSVMVRGLVQRHATLVVIKDADFVVRPAGHAKTIREQRKNVHSFVRGTDVSDEWSESGVKNFEKLGDHCRQGVEAVQLSYNPYKGPHYYRKDTGQVVDGARLVVLKSDKTLWAWGVKNAE